MNLIGSKPFIIGAVAAVAISGVGAYVWKESHRPHILEVYVFALKSGRSIFVRTPEDIRILIDGGANSEVVTELTKILPFYSRHVDVLVATNTEGKNVSGLIDVLRRYRVDRAYIPRITPESIGIASSTDRIYETFINTLAESKVAVYEVGAGDRIDVGENSVGDILFPVSVTNFTYSKASTPDMVVRISFGSTSVVLAGDISTKIQKYLISEQHINTCDVLVVSHNGSAAYISPQFVDAIRPQFFVYSKKMTSSRASTPSLSSKKPNDPLATILIENRFNIQEKGTVRIVSDGKKVSI